MSPSVTGAYLEFARLVPTEIYIEHVEAAQRRHEMMVDFGNGRVNHRAIEAAELCELIGETNDYSLATLEGVNAYFTSELGDGLESDDDTIDALYDSELGYVAEILADKPEIYAFWERKFPPLYGSEQIYQDSAKDRNLTQQDWLGGIKAIPNRELREFLDNVQIESVMNTSIRVLDELMQYYASLTGGESGGLTKESDIYKKCIQAESQLAPICETAGLDRLCDALNNISVKIRYTLGGRSDIVNEAEQYREAIGDKASILSATREMISSQGYNIICEEEVIKNEDRYGVMSREYLLTDSQGKELRCIMRVKTTGGIIKRMADDKKVIDFIGLTYITDVDDPNAGYRGYENSPEKANPAEQMEQVFDDLVLNAITHPKVTLNPSTSRKKRGLAGAIHLRLFDDKVIAFKKRIASYLTDGLDVNDIDVETERKPVHEDDFQVAKVSLLLGPFPIEIQVKTALMRKQERTGRANHRKHKTGVEDDGSLKDMHRRRGDLGKVGITPTPSGEPRTKNLIRSGLNPHAIWVGRRAVANYILR